FIPPLCRALRGEAVPTDDRRRVSAQDAFNAAHKAMSEEVARYQLEGHKFEQVAVSAGAGALIYLTQAPLAPDPGELAKRVKATTTLAELVRIIGQAVVPEGYEEHQAATACAQYREQYERQHGHVKMLGMIEPVDLASIYTEVRIAPPTF